MILAWAAPTDHGGSPLRTAWVLGLAVVFTGCVAQRSSPSREDPSEDPGIEQDAAPDVAVDATVRPDQDIPDVMIPDAAIVDAEPDVPAAPLANPGEPCAEDGDCALGRCMADPTFPDGYCAETNCADDCGAGTVCVVRGSASLCAAGCGEGCREGYTCAEEQGVSVCLPHWAVELRPDGGPCANDAQCAGGTCITDWPGGFCTTINCSSRDDCARGEDEDIDNRCMRQNQPAICVRMCEQQSDCREDYACEPIGRGQGVCFPDPSEPLLTPEAIAASPLEIECFEPSAPGEFEWDYEVAEDTTSYMVVPFSEDGKRIEPQRIEGPGAPVDFQGANQFQAVTAMMFGSLNPTVVPATPHHIGQLHAGAHRYTLDSEAERVCWYQLEESSAGSQIDLNIYLVDVGISAASAPRDANLNALLDQFERVYEGAGIRLGEVRYFNIEGEAAQRYSVIRSELEMGQLLTFTEPPGPTKDDVLSLNVVFIQTFALPNGGGVLGISPGLPGPAGLHGTPNSGVVFTAEFLGQQFREGGGRVVDGNTYTGNVLAHETGHYLGLFHTTETDQRTTDPLRDTPNCRGSDFPFGCPDETNLMFPLAGLGHSEVTPGQIAVIQANPLTKD